jgi:uncharacterized protein
LKSIINRFFINPIFAALILIGMLCVFYFFHKQVDLKPQIASDFFFSKDSRVFKQNELINKKFILAESVILSLPSDNLKEIDYIHKVNQLTIELSLIKGLESVQSLTQGPPDLDAAINNPLWKRFLDTKDKKGSLIICWLEKSNHTQIIRNIQKVINKYQSKKYPIFISGVPYIIDQMRAMLSTDMKKFMTYVVLICSTLLFIIFGSFFILIGSIVSALFAAAATLLLQHHLGQPIGVLTANLGAIIYVLTISHVVFLASNWRNETARNKKTRLAATIALTLPASFWAMFTTFCGFLSLIFVEAQPLIQLGYGGIIGATISFLSAYFIFPLFLRFAGIPENKENKVKRFFFPIHWLISFPICLIILASTFWIGYLGIKKVDTDPSLLSYFKKNDSIYKGIAQVDKSGGSNPLYFVISNKNKLKLKNNESYVQLKKLQNELESHSSVGSVMSLAVLMEETQQNWMVRLLPWGSLLNRLSGKQYGSVARGFITEDLNQALFAIRMKEQGRTKSRNRIINELKAIPGKYNFNIDIIGGSYFMQSELSRSIADSMKKGILSLVVLFTIIALLISFSLLTTLLTTLSIVSIISVVAGSIGYFGIPIDIISSPAINVCLGLAVDGMIHLILDARRNSKDAKFALSKKGIILGFSRQAKPILISATVIASGFSVFYLSQFPPSQRFGLEIVFGSIVAMFITIVFLSHALYFIGLAKK